jgi:hypothetical protein
LCKKTACRLAWRDRKVDRANEDNKTEKLISINSSV